MVIVVDSISFQSPITQLPVSAAAARGRCRLQSWWRPTLQVDVQGDVHPNEVDEEAENAQQDQLEVGVLRGNAGPCVHSHFSKVAFQVALFIRFDSGAKMWRALLFSRLCLLLFFFFPSRLAISKSLNISQLH